MLKNILHTINKNQKLYLLAYIIIVAVATMLHIAYKDLTGIIWISEKEIVPLSGTISSANYYLNIVETGGNKYQSNSERQALELIFYLKEYNKKFILNKTIDIYDYDADYSYYQKRLNKARSVTVWVCSKDSSSYEPRILGIDTDQITLLSKSDTFKNAQRNVITSIIISIGFILLPFVMNQFFKWDSEK